MTLQNKPTAEEITPQTKEAMIASCDSFNEAFKCIKKSREEAQKKLDEYHKLEVERVNRLLSLY